MFACHDRIVVALSPASVDVPRAVKYVIIEDVPIQFSGSFCQIGSSFQPIVGVGTECLLPTFGINPFTSSKVRLHR
jgi:hypothetical protein